MGVAFLFLCECEKTYSWYVPSARFRIAISKALKKAKGLGYIPPTASITLPSWKDLWSIDFQSRKSGGVEARKEQVKALDAKWVEGKTLKCPSCGKRHEIEEVMERIQANLLKELKENSSKTQADSKRTEQAEKIIEKYIAMFGIRQPKRNRGG